MSLLRTSVSLLCLVVPLLAAQPAQAVLIDEIQVYADDINAPGEKGLELHLNTTPSGRSTPDYPGEVVPAHGWRLTPELSLGLAADFEAGLYAPLSRDASGDTRLAGLKVRLKWLPVRPGEDGRGAFMGANLELSRLEHRFADSRTGAELRLIGGWRDERWLLAVNPVFEWNLSDGQGSATPEVSLGVKVARSVAGDVSLGLEYYAGLGTARHLVSPAHQPQSLYAVLDAKLLGADVNFGLGRGLTGAADRITVKTIVGFSF
ncbi:MAG: hypothetical protein JO090_11755 [Rhizobacter sp.]|nr:hypothetical protein [Rhizobacter sp.]